MLRVFHQYYPRQIALHVKKFFSGSVHIIGLGHFEFANGRLLPPQNKNLRDFAVVKEVNAEIKNLMKMAVA